MSTLIHIDVSQDATVAIGFDTPIAMLKECHRKVHDQCQTLQRLESHLVSHGSDQAAAQAAAAIVRYFDMAGPLHHADEEEDVLPALFESAAGADAVRLREMADTLQADHTALNQQWAALRQVLSAIVQGQAVRLNGVDVRAFVSHYRAHIDFEESQVFPMAERLLAMDTMAAIGLSMRRRRGER